MIIVIITVIVVIARRTAMKVYVLSSEYERTVLNVEASDAVFDVKFKIQEAIGIPIHYQRLVFFKKRFGEHEAALALQNRKRFHPLFEKHSIPTTHHTSGGEGRRAARW